VDAIVLRAVTDLAPSIVADVGCANGRFAKVLKPATVIGLERDRALAEAAVDSCASIVHGDLEDPQALDELATHGPFDAILAADVIEHLVHPEDTLRALSALLSPRGALVISVPNLLYYRERIRLATGRFETSPYGGLYDRTHLSFFSVRELEGLIVRSGLTLDSLTGAGRVRPGRRIDRWPAPAPRLKRLVDRQVARIASGRPNLFATSLIVIARPA
jgi:SAM-dependent methyltransferase